jgi:hypothetical protein
MHELIEMILTMVGEEPHHLLKTVGIDLVVQAMYHSQVRFPPFTIEDIE